MLPEWLKQLEARISQLGILEFFVDKMQLALVSTAVLLLHFLFQLSFIVLALFLIFCGVRIDFRWINFCLSASTSTTNGGQSDKKAEG